jgi:site-specific DNA-methyltransferase (cytosine-N4-specific)
MTRIQYRHYKSLKRIPVSKVGIQRGSQHDGAHGLHEYKGKFNPQIVSSILNILEVNEKSKILEPFCGSGTTLYESALNNLEGGFRL